MTTKAPPAPANSKPIRKSQADAAADKRKGKTGTTQPAIRTAIGEARGAVSSNSSNDAIAVRSIRTVATSPPASGTSARPIPPPQAQSSGDTSVELFPKRPFLPKTAKPTGGIHPKAVKDFRPAAPLAIQANNNANAYGNLTNDSPYSAYAWEFLRRNRFYQELVDGKVPSSVEHWGYRPTTEHEATYGLLRQKPYRESVSTGQQPLWLGIHSFQHDLSAQTRKTTGAQVTSGMAMDIEYPKHQIAIVFDLAPLLGDGSSLVGIQIELARAELMQLAAKRGAMIRKRMQGPSKSLLRAQLRVADLLSSPVELAVADDPNSDTAYAKQRLITLKDLQDRHTVAGPSLKMSDIVDLLPSFDAKRDATHGNKKDPKRTPSMQQRLNRVSELAKGAWEGIYQWEMLKWVQLDSWAAPGPATVKPGATEQSAGEKANNLGSVEAVRTTAQSAEGQTAENSKANRRRQAKQP